MSLFKSIKTFRIALIALGVVAVFALIIATKPAPAVSVAAGSSGTLVSASPQYDFGAVPLTGGLVRTDYAVRNAGTEPVVIDEVWTSCMCTTAVLKKGSEYFGPFGMPGHGGPRRSVSLSLAPGEVVNVEAVFDPAAHGPAGVGPVSRSVLLSSSAGDPLELAFTAIITP